MRFESGWDALYKNNQRGSRKNEKAGDRMKVEIKQVKRHKVLDLLSVYSRIII